MAAFDGLLVGNVVDLCASWSGAIFKCPSDRLIWLHERRARRVDGAEHSGDLDGGVGEGGQGLGIDS